MAETYRQTADRVLAMLQRADGNDPSRGHLTMNNWEWPTGVALYGIYKTYQQSGDRSILDYLTGWYGDMLARAEKPHRNVNTVAPVLTLACLYGETKNPEYLPEIVCLGDRPTEIMEDFRSFSATRKASRAVLRALRGTVCTEKDFEPVTVTIGETGKGVSAAFSLVATEGRSSAQWMKWMRKTSSKRNRLQSRSHTEATSRESRRIHTRPKSGEARASPALPQEMTISYGISS